MSNTKKNTDSKVSDEDKDLRELARFREKNLIQNEALKKLVEGLKSLETNKKESK